MINSLLQPLIRKGENGRVEFKQSIARLDSMGQTVCAFLNADGGTLVIGVSDDGNIIGVEDVTRIRNRIRQDLDSHLSPQAAYSISIEEIAHKQCVAVDVPAGPEPPYVYRDRIYVRQGAQSVQATGQVISGLIHHRQAEPLRWERMLALGVDLEDLDASAIRRTIQRKYLLREDLDAEQASVAACLQKLNMIERGYPLNSAVVLFGKHPALLYPQTRVRVARFGSDDSTQILDHRTFEGHAFALLEHMQNFLQTYIAVQTTLPANALARIDTPAYPFGAVREALVNALLHRDYAAYDGGIAVRLFPDRLEIWNSGTFPTGLTPQTIKEGYISRPHNPDMAHVFQRRGLAERMGIGAHRIVFECAAAGMPEPTWEERGSGILLTLRQSLTAPARQKLFLSARQTIFVEQMPPGERITAQAYHRQYAADVSDRQARTELSQLVTWGYLRRQGNGPATSYERTPLFARANESEDAN